MRNPVNETEYRMQSPAWVRSEIERCEEIDRQIAASGGDPTIGAGNYLPALREIERLRGAKTCRACRLHDGCSARLEISNVLCRYSSINSERSDAAVFAGFAMDCPDYSPEDPLDKRAEAARPLPPLCPDHPQPQVGDVCPVCVRDAEIESLRHTVQEQAEEIRGLVNQQWVKKEDHDAALAKIGELEAAIRQLLDHPHYDIDGHRLPDEATDCGVG